MDVRVRIGDSQIFTLKQAVLLYEEGNRTFATLHEVKSEPSGVRYLCAGQSVTTGFLETLAAGLGAGMAAEVLPEHVLARTPELIVWWSCEQQRLMFFGDGSAESRNLNGKKYPAPALSFHDSWPRTLCACSRRGLPTEGKHTTEERSLLEHGRSRESLLGQHESSRGCKCRLIRRLGERILRQRIHSPEWRSPSDNSSARLYRTLVRIGGTEAPLSRAVSRRLETDAARVRPTERVRDEPWKRTIFIQSY